MKLIKAKMIRGSIAMSRMNWFCGEFKTHQKDERHQIGCMDMTVDPVSIFFIPKGQPPETFDFHKGAWDTFEQVAMAQLTVMEWDKLKDGDEISLDDEMEEKVREWGGHIWVGGGVTEVQQRDDGIFELKSKKIPVEERLIKDRFIRYNIKNKEF